MITATDMMSDNRFFINEFDAKRIIEKLILSYKIKTIKLGSIMMNMFGEYLLLEHTDVFKYLDRGSLSLKLIV